MHNNIPRNSFGTLCYVLCCFSHVQLFETPWTVACQVPLPMGFSRQEFWSGLPFPSPGDLPDPGIEPASLASSALADVFFTTSTTWEVWIVYIQFKIGNINRESAILILMTGSGKVTVLNGVLQEH